MIKKSILLLPVLFAVVLSVPARAGFLDVSDAKEARMGKKEADAIVEHYGLYEDEAEKERVEAVGGLIIKICERPELEYHFYVINSKVVNAFALPGGYIFLTSGIMDFVDDDDELASVIAHEIVHVTKKHGITLYKKSLKDALLNFLLLIVTRDPNAVVAGQMIEQSRIEVYGRSAEIEADRYGIEYMYKAGYKPEAFMRFLQKIERLETHRPDLLEDYYDFHPPMEVRKSLVEENFKRLGLKPPGGRGGSVSGRLVAGEVCDEGDKEKCYGVVKGPQGEIMRLGDKGDAATPYLRAQIVVSTLNRLLGKELAMYELNKRAAPGGVELTIRNTRVVRVLPGDLAAGKAASADELMDSWINGLKNFIWRDFLNEEL